VRLGLHDSAVDQCSERGLILLQLCGDDLPLAQMEAELKAIDSVHVKHMTLDFNQ